MQAQDQIDERRRSIGTTRLFLLSFGYVGVRFLLSPLRTRLLTEIMSKELYGSLTLAVMTLTFIASFSSLGGFEFLVRRLPGQPVTEQAAWLHLLMSRLALPGWLLAGGIALGCRLTGYFQGVTWGDLALLWVGLGCTSWLLYRVFFFLGCGDLIRVRCIQLAQNDFWFIAIAVTGFWVALSFTLFLIVWVAWLGVTVIGVRLFSPSPRPKAKPAGLLKEVFRFGLPLLPMICSDILFRLADRYIILLYLNLKVVADYTLCMNVAMMVYVVGASLMDLSLPALYAAVNRKSDSSLPEPTEETQRCFSVMMRHIAGIGLIAGLALMIFYQDIFRIVSGAAFRNAAVLLPWMAFIPLIFLLTLGVSRALLALNRTRLVGGATLAAAVTNIVLNFLTVPRWGAIGAALSTLLSMAILTGVLAWILGCRRWLRRDELRPLSILCASVLCGAGFFAIAGCLETWGPWARLGTGAVLVGFAFWAFRIFRPGDLREMSPRG